MDQFAVYRVRSLLGADRRHSELVVILQHAHARAVETVIVAPLHGKDRLPPLERIRPLVAIEGREYIVAVDRLAAIDRRTLGERIGSLDAHRYDLIRALDVLLTGF
jgi:hypothetical protein